MSILGRLVLIGLLLSGTLPAMGGSDDARSAGLSGVFLVCKEYGTLRGTFLTSVRGRDITRLNYLFGEGVDPRLSPIGDRVLYTSTRGGTPGVWIMDRTGEQQKRVCDGDQGNWFPDGQRILLRREGQILERSLESGRETVLSPAGWKSCSSPVCSPDGRKLLLAAHETGKQVIWLIALGEAAPKRLVEGELLGAPRWSPGGKRIAYQCGPHLWMIDADGSNQRQLTTAGGIQRRPAWSPDGSAIAYCQGPNPKGPWQMAVISIDGAKTVSIPQGSARSVLCSDWGVEEPGGKPEPKESASLPPRVRLWGIDPPLSETPADWAAFCRERKGWNAIPAENASHQSLRGGCAVENQDAVLLLLAGRAGAVFIPRSAAPIPIQLTLLDAQGKEVGAVESVQVLACGPDEARLESSSRSAGGVVRAAWTIGGSRALIQVTPVENAGKIRAAAPIERVVVPDRFGNDLVADPESLPVDRSLLPWAPLVVGLCGSGSDMLVFICPEQGQSAELHKGPGPSLASADVALQNRGVSLGMISGQRVWHLERFGKDRAANPVRFKWRMPHAANWRLTVQGDGERYSALFSDKQSELFDEENVLLPQRDDFATPPRLGLIYLYGRTAGTPPAVLTPLDLLRDALGLEAARQALDEDGLTGYRRAARPTTWADFSVTIESLDYLFERQLEVQDGVYARHLCDDLPSFVEGMDQRLQEYADFSRQIQTLGAAGDKPSPPAAGLIEDVAAFGERLRQLDRRQQGLSSAKELLPLCAKIKELTAAESSDNRKEFERCCRELAKVAGPREELLKAYRKLAIEARDSAGRHLQDGAAPLVQAGLAGLAEKIRALSQGVLRNRFYTEADWRGEDYSVPGFWLGPRPYE